MRNIKLTIEYDGTNFNGWQVQARGNRTVQGELESCLQKIFKKKTRIYGSGRTDSGVHALGQVANFKTDTKISVEALCRALNTYLPADVAILKAQEVKPDFHAQFNARRKTYRYTILNRFEPCAVNQRFCTHIPYYLNLRRMRAAAKHVIGRNDFMSFVASDPCKRNQERDTRRRVYRSEFRKSKDYIIYEIEADGFLYKMVRNIAGTLIDVGCGKFSVNDVHDIIKAKNRIAAGDTAPPQGLCLVSVKY